MRDMKQDFPILSSSKNPIVYLDSAATTQKPIQVLDSIRKYYEESNANPHRGSYHLSMMATDAMEEGRNKVKKFLNVNTQKGELIFTKNATESLNLVAYSFGNYFVNEGDEILISIQEHHSNLVSWQRVAKERKATLKYIYLKEDGTFDYPDFLSKINHKTKVVAVTHVSNVLGFINPIKDIINVSKKYGAVTVIDGTQAVPHLSVDLTDLDPDFYIFSGHKLLGPMGVGGLYGTKELLDRMPPFLYGGDMIDYVEEQETDFAPIPAKYEGGTQNVASIVGLSTAIDYLQNIGMEQILAMEQDLVAYTIKKMKELSFIEILGDLDQPRIGVIPFQVKDVHPHDVASILDQDGICIRAGNHCAQPLLKHMGYSSVCRVSFYLYNTREDVDFFINKLKEVRRWLGYEA
ncbi:MAG TPA: cysteine desulfurase [Candidatus Merdenecus merdavium]|nr:cysteine desulfurase [Candidatus Merdenecus merdavium]